MVLLPTIVGKSTKSGYTGRVLVSTNRIKQRVRGLGRTAKLILLECARFAEKIGEIPVDGIELWHAAHGHMPWIPEQKFRDTLKRLRRLGYLQILRHHVSITPKTRLFLPAFEETTLELQRPDRWDGKWRVVIWDVPEKRRELRDRLRATLTRIGFVHIQHSVWVCPWPCRDEIEWLREHYRLDNRVLFFETSKIDGDDALRARFEL